VLVVVFEIDIGAWIAEMVVEVMHKQLKDSLILFLKHELFVLGFLPISIESTLKVVAI